MTSTSTSNSCPSSNSRQRGSTLLEVLVAILILSVGLLGIAGLQASSLRFSQGGWARAAVASNLADFADRVRSNPNSTTTAYQLLDNYAKQRADLDAGNVVTVPNTLSTPQVLDCEAKDVICTPAQLAAMQLANWRLALNRDMPGAAAFVSGTSDTSYVVTAIWFDRSNVKADRTTLVPTVACSTVTGTDISSRTCCPDAAAVPDGARCTNMVVVP